MKDLRWSRFACTIGAIAFFVAAARPASAQTATTGTLSGSITDQQGGLLPGATVTAMHVPTGTKYDSVTGGDGRYEIPNVRVGGPYTVTASLSGFKDQDELNVTVALGENRAVDLRLTLATLSENVTVTAQTQVIDTARAGTAANIPAAIIENLPTIQRNIF